ncbi:MAG: hypothetical protein AB7F75_09710 [Planctomycetota bacterium]
MKARRGFVLIIVVAVLGILAYIAIDFVKQSQVSRTLSLGSLHRVKARLSARSVLEKAMMACDEYGNKGAPHHFSINLMSSGDDVNRNGVADGGEDLAGDGFSLHVPLEQDRTPSLALEDPSNPGRALNLVLDGRSIGVTWRNEVNPDQWGLARVERPCLGLNSGVVSGRGEEGTRYQADFGTVYSASNIRHPFNRPIVCLLNAWGNYHKYRAMVRTGQTYDFNQPIDADRNLGTPLGGPLYYQNPYGQFDRFLPSGNHLPTAPNSFEIPLGDRIIQQRPAQGYKDLRTPLLILQQYISEWKHAIYPTAWLYSNGLAIADVPRSTAMAIGEEFRALVSLEEGPDKDPVFKRGLPGLAPAMEPPGEIAFSSHEGRQFLNTRVYRVDGFRADVNAAPVSLLAAMIYGVTVDSIRRYSPGEAYTNVTSMIRGVHPLMHSNINVHFQSENNHPCYYTYGSAFPFIYKRPLFSMTESIRLAEDIVVRRNQAPFAGPSDFLDFLRNWNKGYDAKEKNTSQLAAHKFTSSLGATSLNNAFRYRDVVQQNRRGRILGYLLNPIPMSTELIWDDALPKSIDPKVHGLGGSHVGSPYQASEGFQVRFLFDLFDPHERTVKADVSTRTFRLWAYGIVSSLGKSLAVERISATRDMFFKLEIYSQKDFQVACRDPLLNASSLGGQWVTYPEMPGLPPSTWEGHLALKPQLQVCPMGEDLRLRAPLSGYEATPITNQPDLWPVGSRQLVGPSESPARGKLLNSLRPNPSEPIPSLFPSNPAEVDTASDLLPGGGIRMSPYHNCFYRTYTGAFGLPLQYYTRREALLVFRNARVHDADDAIMPTPVDPPTAPHDPGPVGKVLPRFHEGAVSFYFKPRFAVAYSVQNNHAETLFYTPFVIEDQETTQRLLNFSIPNPSNVRSTFVASMRLLRRPVDDVVNVATQLNNVYPTWPWVLPYEIVLGGMPVPHQSNAGPFLFSNMHGYESLGGVKGFLMTRYAQPVSGPYFFNQASSVPNGDGREGHWGARNPHAAEGLELEFLITKFASSVITDNVLNTSVNPTYQLWDSNDAMSLLGQRCAYINPMDKGLYLLDTADPSKPDYHTVRKSFILGHPWNMGTPASDLGMGPRDRMGNHQCLVEPGRWNHIFLAWRDLYDLLNNGSAHKGGCLAVWVNGTFRKVLAGSHFEVAGLFFQQDYYPAYRHESGSSFEGGPTDYWYNPLYLASDYPLNLQQVVTFPSFQVQDIVSGRKNALPLAPMGTDGHSHLMNVAYMRPENGNFNVKKQLLYTHFPSRFHFGHEPCTMRTATSNPFNPHFVSNVTWGAYMDVQIFSKANDSVLAADGGFEPNPDLPDYDNFSVYPPDASGDPAILYPCNLAPEIDNVVAVSWSASLPEFHQFWDDQNDAVSGPDPLDRQRLALRIEIAGNTEADLVLSQDPAEIPVDHWRPSNPMRLANTEDLKLILNFAGPQKVYATPLVHGVEILYRGKRPADQTTGVLPQVRDRPLRNFMQNPEVIPSPYIPFGVTVSVE